MALDIGIRSGIPLTAAYSDLSHRFLTGKSMIANLYTGVCMEKAILLFEVTKCNWQLYLNYRIRPN